MADLTADQSPPRDEAGPTDQPSAEALALFEKNMISFKARVPAFYEVFLEYRPSKRLLWYPDGEVNVETATGLMYATGGRKENRAQVIQAVNAPHRVIFRQPGPYPDELMAEIEGKLKPVGPDDFATKRYDDVHADWHVMKFNQDVFAKLEEEGVTFEAAPCNPHPFYLCLFGLGLGTSVPELLEAMKPRVTMIAEMDVDLIYFSMFLVDWEELFTKVHEWKGKVLFLVETDPGQIFREITGRILTEGLIGIDGLVSVVHTPCAPPLRVAATELFSERMVQAISFLGFAVDEFNMVKNSTRNLASGKRRVLNKIKEEMELPVIIVGSGPSVEDTIPFIKENADKAIIIAGGSAATVLMHHGIKPDFQCNLERDREVLLMHQQIAEKYDMSDVYGVLSTTCWPGVDAYFKDTIYFFRAPLAPVAIFAETDDEILPREGPMVVNLAFSFATKLRAKEIYLCGVDMGSVDPRRSARSTLAAWNSVRNLTIPVRGNFGRTIFTDIYLLRQKTHLEDQIRSNGVRTYNLSNGAKIEGAIPLRMHEVLPWRATVEKRPHVDALVQQFPVFSRERVEAAWHSAQLRDNIHSFMRELVKIVEEADAWDYDLVAAYDTHTQIGYRGMKAQFPVRLLRGSLINYAMCVGQVINRIPGEEGRAKAWGVLKPMLLDAIFWLERDSYAMVDELEWEFDNFTSRM